MYQVNNVKCGESVLKYLANHIHILVYTWYKSTTWFVYIHGITKGNTTYTKCVQPVLLNVYDTDYWKTVPAQRQKLSTELKESEIKSYTKSLGRTNHLISSDTTQRPHRKHASNNSLLMQECIYRATAWQWQGHTQTHRLSFNMTWT
jgi:hypothetical protein